MTDDELRSAAARLTGRAIEYYRKDRAVAQREIDIVDLAEAYLREHPADDGDPVTEEWLRSVGAKKGWHSSKVTFDRNDALSVGFWSVDDGWKAVLLHSEHSASDIVRGLQTRRAVRDLCRCLGFELMEAAR